MKIRSVMLRTSVAVLILPPAVTEFGQPQLTSAYAITEVQFPAAIRLGDEFEIVVKARNLGVETSFQNVQIGFPDKYDLLALVETNCPVMVFRNEIGSQMRGGYNTVDLILKYPFFEGVIRPSLPGETIWIRVRVKPREAGIFRFETQTGGGGHFFPNSGHKDQHDQYCLVHEVRVVP